MLLQRRTPRHDGIFGDLSTDSGESVAVTLEHAHPQGEGVYAPKVPAGTYVCEKRMSPRFGYPVFMLKDVPGHDFIEIHRANWQVDLDGCIGIGATIAGSPQGQMIANSKQTFDRFMADHEGIASFPLTILDAEPA